MQVTYESLSISINKIPISNKVMLDYMSVKLLEGILCNNISVWSGLFVYRLVTFLFSSYLMSHYRY